MVNTGKLTDSIVLDSRPIIWFFEGECWLPRPVNKTFHDILCLNFPSQCSVLHSYLSVGRSFISYFMVCHTNISNEEPPNSSVPVVYIFVDAGIDHSM